MNLELSVERQRQDRESSVTVADPGPKPDDHGPEQRRRHRALVGLRAALDVEEEVRATAERAVTERATTATWLGASLADLATVTGRTRQAARKRWPALGDVARRRRWLGYHVDEVLWAARLVLEHRGAITASGGAPFVTRADALERRTAEVADSFGTQPSPTEDATARWRALDALVDRDLRACVETSGAPAEGMAGFAVHGAGGVLAHYDTARRASGPE